MVSPSKDPLESEKDHANNESIIDMINNIFTSFVLF